MTENREDELRQLKSDISIVEFLAARGYEIDNRRSWSSGKVMVRGDDKITVGRGRDGNWVWIGRRGAGSIIDLLQIYDGLSLGKCRVELRPWLSGARCGPPELREASRSIQPTTTDLMAVQAAYATMDLIAGGVHPYLNHARGLPPSLLSLPFLRERVREDDSKGFRNVVFPHFNRGGLCGYIACNQGFKGFQGTKGLFGTIPGPDDRRLVIAEAVLDGLSYLKINGPEGARMISFEGTMNHQQPELILSAVQKLPAGEVIAAVDNDEGGDKFDHQLREIFDQAGRPELTYRRESPLARGLDWNAHLLQLRPPSPSPGR